jgi:hypothetical protein
MKAAHVVPSLIVALGLALAGPALAGGGKKAFKASRHAAVGLGQAR